MSSLFSTPVPGAGAGGGAVSAGLEALALPSPLGARHRIAAAQIQQTQRGQKYAAVSGRAAPPAKLFGFHRASATSFREQGD